MAVEAKERDDLRDDFVAWQRQVMRQLERLERSFSRLPITFAPGERLPIPSHAPGSPGGRREPEAEFQEAGGWVFLTLEMLGVEERDIDLTVMEESLTVKVDTPRARYYREVHLPPGLDLERVEANYRNGVLDVAIGRRGGG